MEQKKISKILVLLLVMQWAFVQLISKFPNYIERFYSNGLYVFLNKIYQFLLGWIPFSIGDILYLLLILYLIKQLVNSIKKKTFNAKKSLWKLGAIISIVFFVFHFNWGLNYYRIRISEKLKIDIQPYSSNDLELFTKRLITKLNETHISITKNDTILIDNPATKKEIREKSYLVYNEFQQNLPDFKHQKLHVKSSLFSVPLAYMGFAGYLNPFTNEAQVNYLIPKNTYTATVCHELAHQIGIGPESEANFVGYLAGINSSDKYFQYGAYLNALRYCLNELFYTSPEKFEELKALLNVGILKDLQQNQDFWELYQNWSEKYFEIFYDNFLKANNQEDGIKSYSKMVVLLVNYYKNNEL
ncbi:DUF3810 domain-containing protein [Lutibacter sp.]|uniref:DUF3810 domain-containing protein n=1 Tax=Lutibacter sp. TaxID=1925666 RepID=UPI001A1A8CF6|nr:DUF3810 domain-containing protein [Lutibacter sp.]MBI9042293.1 DUF3810 domain-containing protein [Lutibacter sp.]